MENLRLGPARYFAATVKLDPQWFPGCHRYFEFESDRKCPIVARRGEKAVSDVKENQEGE